MDQGFGIVVAALVATAALGLGGVARARAASARVERLRGADRLEIEVISVPRVTGLVLAAVAPFALGGPLVAAALGEWGRAHALPITLAILAGIVGGLLVGAGVAPRWARIGALVLDGDTLALVVRGDARKIDLGSEWALAEAATPDEGGQMVTVVVIQGSVRLAFRYGSSLPSRSGEGVAVGAEGRVLHERLRARLG